MRFAELFAGVGGYRLGLEQAGLQCVFASEIDKYARATYAENFGEEPAGDIREIGAADVPEHDILTAGFPCQPFSTSGKREGLLDSRGTLFAEIVRIAKHHRPKAIFMENVPGLMTKKMDATLSRILYEIGSAGYFTSFEIADASHYGIPQKRRRVYLTSYRCDPREFMLRQSPGVMPPPTNEPCRLADVLEDESTVGEKYYLSDKALDGAIAHRKRHEEAGNGFGFQIADPDKPANTLLSRYYKGGNEIMISRGNGLNKVGKTGDGGRGTHIYDSDGVAATMTSSGTRAATELYRVGDLSGKNTQGYRVYSTDGVATTISASGGGINKGATTGLYQIGKIKNNNSANRIYSSDGVAKTQLALSGGWGAKTGIYGIQGRVRRLTPREAFRVQGFPDSFKFPKDLSETQLYKQAGNAIIPHMAYIQYTHWNETCKREGLT